MGTLSVQLYTSRGVGSGGGFVGVKVGVGVSVGTAVSAGVSVGHGCVSVGGTVFVGDGVFVCVGVCEAVGELVIVGNTAVAIKVGKFASCVGEICGPHAASKNIKMKGRNKNSGRLINFAVKRFRLCSAMTVKDSEGKNHRQAFSGLTNDTVDYSSHF